MDSNDQKLSCFFMFVYEWIVYMISVCSTTRLSNLFTQVHIHDKVSFSLLFRERSSEKTLGFFQPPP
jgi:hypothetical protein